MGSVNPPKAIKSKFAKSEIGAPQIQDLFAKMLGIRNLRRMSNGQGPPAEGEAHEMRRSRAQPCRLTVRQTRAN